MTWASSALGRLFGRLGIGGAFHQYKDLENLIRKIAREEALSVLRTKA